MFSNARSLRGSLVFCEIEDIPVGTNRPVFEEEADNASSLPWISRNSRLTRLRDLPCVVIPPDRIDTPETGSFSLPELLEAMSSDFLGQSFQLTIV